MGLALALGALAVRAEAERLRVVASTSLILDVARQVAGAEADVVALIPPGLDPHAFSMTPRDRARLQEADLVLINGFGLETFLDRALDAVPSQRVVTVSAGGIPRAAEEPHAPHEEAAEHEQDPAQEDEHDHAHAHAHGNLDPHVWFDPTWVMRWAENIAHALAERDPAHAADYRMRAEAYRAELEQLDAWIAARLGAIPEERRVVVTDHEEFGYLADRYHLTIVGALIPNVSTLAEVSARELADLQTRMREQGARVIVVGQSTSPALAERIARDTGARVVRLNTHSLGPSGSESDSYLGFMRANISALADALQGAAP